MATGAAQDTCPSCRDVLLGNGVIHTLTCGHSFHKECTDEWRAHQDVDLEDLTCPICKITSTDVDNLKSAPDAPDLPENRQPVLADFTVAGEDAVTPTDGSVIVLADDELADTADGGGGTRIVPEHGDLNNELAEFGITPIETSVRPGGPAPAIAVAEESAAVETAVQPGIPAPASAAIPKSSQFTINDVGAWTKPDDVICGSCKDVCDIVHVRLVNKSTGTFRCRACHTTHSKIYNSFGAGMATKLKQIPDDEKEKFFGSAKKMSNKEVHAALSSICTRYEIWEQAYELGGAFKPLAVWGHMGYDTKAIEDFSLEKDIMVHRMFGKVYRVVELAVHERGHSGRSSTAQLAVEEPKSKRQRTTALPYVEKTDAEDDGTQYYAEEEADATHPNGTMNASTSSSLSPTRRSKSSSSSSSSSSTSSSTKQGAPLTKKQKKKRKEDKKKKKKEKRKKKDSKKANKKDEKAQLKEIKDEKEAVKQAALDEKRLERQTKKNEQDAVKAVERTQKMKIALATQNDKKLEKAIADSEKLMRAAGADLVEGPVMRPNIDHLRCMKDCKHACATIAAGLVPPANFTLPSITEVKKIVDYAKKLDACLAMSIKACVHQQQVLTASG